MKLERFYLPATVFWAGFIFFQSLVKETIPAKLGFTNDIIPAIGHFFAYAVLCYLLIYSLRNSGLQHAVPLAFLLCVVYGMLLELLQGSTLTRMPSVFDALANTGGAFIIAMADKYKHEFRINPAD
ncbi:MAG TPA: hypothetical protein HA224_03385 [Nanoarchaeota archaeon]|nr:hypothetical protein [Nanoarchaeota archaeon]